MPQTDSRALRSVLGCYATGVAIITTCTPGRGLAGVTVNSFASVSLDPALILFSLARTAKVLESFQQAEHFAVNMLALGQESLSNMFARPSTASFAEIGYARGSQGCALLTECLAQLECTKVSELDGGDHVIFLGRVDLYHLRGAVDPLLFYRGRYGTYVPERFSKLPPPDSALGEFSVSGWG